MGQSEYWVVALDELHEKEPREAQHGDAASPGLQEGREGSKGPGVRLLSCRIPETCQQYHDTAYVVLLNADSLKPCQGSCSMIHAVCEILAL